MQPRQKLVLEFWDRSKALSIKNKKYRNSVKELFNLLLKKDFADNDITTNLLIKAKNASARVVAKEDGIVAGLAEFEFLNKDLKMIYLKGDGDRIKNNDIIVELKGNAKKILSRERTNLNLLQRMSGIATLINSLNKKLENNIRIAATRKTLWGLMDKKAVSAGGGLTHRLNLKDGILIKENHLKLINYDIEKAIKLVKNKSRYIEIEVEDEWQAINASVAAKKILRNNRNIFAIMLDKIKPTEIKEIIHKLKNLELYEQILLEASGNINENNLSNYSDCGVDIISMGYITNSSKALNLSLETR